MGYWLVRELSLYIEQLFFELRVVFLVFLFWIIIISSLVGLILLILQMILTIRAPSVRRSFECGFERVGVVHTNYRMYFFLLLLVFIIFDIEIV